MRLVVKLRMPSGGDAAGRFVADVKAPPGAIGAIST